MSCSDDFIAHYPRGQPCLLVSSSSSRASSSTRTRHPSPTDPRICSSTSPSHTHSSQADLDCLLDPLDDITLDSDLDRRSASSATLSHRVSPRSSMNQLLIDASHASSESTLPARQSGSRPSRSLYPLYEPGQMTAQRTQRLRSRIAAVIMSLPATSEEQVAVGVDDEDEPCKAARAPPVAQAPKLRRVSGVGDLRRAFRDGDHGPVHFASVSSSGVSKACNEFGVLAGPTTTTHLTSRSSLHTLVELGNVRPQSSGDLKTLCGSTFSSVSITSRYVTKVQSTLPPSQSSQIRSPSDTSQPILPRKHLVHNSLTLRTHRHVSLQLDTRPPWPSGEMVWSCAKISQSAIKRTARRGHAPRRVFSNPVAVLPS